MSDDNIFVDGLFVDKPHEKAPDFIKCKLGINRKELGNWLRSKADDRINIVIKESKGGKWYATVDDWVPDSSKATDKPAERPVAPAFNEFDDDIPF